jgi:hypothetical protein
MPDDEDDPVNGSTYAYVIREEKSPAVAPRPVSPQTASPQSVSPQAVSPQAVSPQAVSPQSVASERVAPRAGQSPEGQQEPAVEQARGAFEPPRQQHPELAGLLHIDYDLLAGDGTGSLGRLKDLYETAEAIGDEGLDKHFEELLERQRKLISAYFDEYRATSGSAGTGTAEGTGTQGSTSGKPGTSGKLSPSGMPSAAGRTSAAERTSGPEEASASGRAGGIPLGAAGSR